MDKVKVFEGLLNKFETDEIRDFGKYSGKTLPQIKEIDSGYISWAKENMSREPVRSLLAQL